jgi:WD40 repeat protein
LGHQGKVDAVNFTQDKEKLVSGGSDRTLRIWDMNKGLMVKNMGCKSSIKTMASYYSEPLIVTGHHDGSIRVYSLRDEKSAAVY